MSLPSRLDLLQGTLDLLILRTLQTEPKHGWAISERIQQISQDVLHVNQGSLYPALHRLEQAGLLSSRWTTADSGRRRRVYTLTKAGNRALAERHAVWRQFSDAITGLLAGTRPRENPA